jgi:hypothetical protein
MHLVTINRSESSTRDALPAVRRPLPRRRRFAERRRPGRATGPRRVVPACPACGSPIRGRATECGHCGAYIDAHARRRMAAGQRLVGRYRLGMKILGFALTILGALSLATALVLILLLAHVSGGIGGLGALEFLAITALLVLVCGVPLWLGIAAFKYHNWVNWLVAIFYGLGLLAAAVVTVHSGQLEVSAGALVELALFAIAVINLVNMSRIRELGLSPRFGAVLNRSRRPRARARR